MDSSCKERQSFWMEYKEKSGGEQIPKPTSKEKKKKKLIKKKTFLFFFFSWMKKRQSRTSYKN
jgi:hypothetical protein